MRAEAEEHEGELVAVMEGNEERMESSERNKVERERGEKLCTSIFASDCRVGIGSCRELELCVTKKGRLLRGGTEDASQYRTSKNLPVLDDGRPATFEATASEMVPSFFGLHSGLRRSKARCRKLDQSALCGLGPRTSDRILCLKASYLSLFKWQIGKAAFQRSWDWLITVHLIRACV